MRDAIKSTGAVTLVTGGIGTAFCLAACCAIPILLAGLGLSAGWLAPIVSASQPQADLLTAVSVIALAGGVAVVVRAPKTCRPGSLCARPAFRWSVIAAAGVGAVLLLLSVVYA